MCLNNAVWDINSGVILKLAEGKQISHAVYGLESLSEENIKKRYGDPPVFDSLHYPAICKIIDDKEDAHWVL